MLHCFNIFTLQIVAYARKGRPDIDFTASFLKPNHLAKTGMTSLIPTDLQLRGFGDVAFNISPLTPDGHSHYGYLVRLGHSLISSILQRSMSSSLSSFGAVMSSKNSATPSARCTITIFEDNQSCITMLQREPRNFVSKSRHARVKWAFFRDEYSKRAVKMR